MACPSFGLGLALGALSQYDSNTLIAGCDIALADWCVAPNADIEARVRADGEHWSVEVPGLRGTLFASSAPQEQIAFPSGDAVAFDDATLVLGCGLCGIATAALSRAFTDADISPTSPSLATTVQSDRGDGQGCGNGIPDTHRRHEFEAIDSGQREAADELRRHRFAKSAYATSKPRCAKAITMPRPMPRLPPVTSAMGFTVRILAVRSNVLRAVAT